MNKKSALEAYQTLAKYLEKFPERTNTVNVLVSVYNLTYLDSELRSILTSFTDKVLETSCKVDGVKPVLYGEKPKKPSKPQIIYRDKIVYVERPVIRKVTKVIKEKPTLPKRIPVLKDVVREGRKVATPATPSPTPPDQPKSLPERSSAPSEASRKPKRSPTYYFCNNGRNNFRVPVGQPVPKGFVKGFICGIASPKVFIHRNQSRLDELVSKQQKKASKQFRNGSWWHSPDGKKQVRLSANQKPPAGFIRGMLRRVPSNTASV